MATSRRKTGAKAPAAKKPATKKPAAKKPAAKEPAAKKPAAKKPAAKKPTAKKPTQPARPKAGASKLAAGGAARSRDMTDLVDLSPEAAGALVRPRDGFEDHIEPLFALYADHAGALGALSVGVDEARARLSRWESLAAGEIAAQQAADKANKHLEMVKETRALQASKVWGVMLEIYDKAKPAAKKDATIAAAIKAFAKFMSTGPRKGK